ncbi:MAG: BppU family phage baseplate upper protein [Clostridia bacterium]|nr:BppU family phage baseplate upper protein [Clostridia bacterium]
MKRIENLTIDVKNNEYNEIKLKQMDTTRLIIKLLDDSQPISLVGHTANVIFTKPTGQIIIQDAIIDQEQKVIVDLLEDCLMSYGKAKMEVELKKSTEVLSSFQIIIQIEKTSKENITPDNTPNYVESMEKAVKQLQEQGKEMLNEYRNLIATVETVLANVTARGHIYGIKRKITDLNGNINTSPSWTKIYDNEGLVAQAHIGNSTSVRNDYDNIYPWNSIITINYDTENNNVNAYYGDDNFAFDGSNGEVFTRYPKMWIKRLFPVQEEDGYYEYRMIADFEVQDFIEVESWMEGRYEMYVDADNIGHSRSGVYPKYNANIKQFEQYAKNLGDTYCLEDWHRFVMDTLYLVEYANNNSQTMLGRGVTEWSEKKALVAENNVNRIIVDNANVFPVGRSISIGTSAAWNSGVAKDRTVTSIETYSNNGVNGYAVYFDGEAVNIALENHIWGSAQKTGDCDSLGMKSGCLINDGRHSVIYRGKEQPLGNMYKFLSGINIKDYQTYICYEPSQYAPDTFNEHYHKLGYVNPNETEGYTKIMGFDKDNPLIALPTELGAGSTTGYCDYCYSKNAGNRVARVGGNFFNGGSAGLFYWYFNYSSSSSYWYIGARLLKYQ